MAICKIKKMSENIRESKKALGKVEQFYRRVFETTV
jgi:hypothetical protein